MDEQLTLPVTYKGQELEFPLQVVPQGYTYRFAVRIDELTVIYERDDSGELRALLEQPDEAKGKLPDQALLAAIGEVIRSLTE